MNRFSFVVLAAFVAVSTSLAQNHNQGDHNHGDHGAIAPKVAPPTVFLDKSPRIVEYQLKRLDNQRLLMVERKTNDEKYIPVYSAILTRVGMSPQYRQEAVKALVKLEQSNAADVLLDAISTFDSEDADEARAARQLAGMLLRQPKGQLSERSESLQQAMESDDALLRSIGAAGLVLSGKTDAVVSQLDDGEEAKLALLSAVSLIPKPAVRNSLRNLVVEMLENADSPKVTRSAINALGFIRKDDADTFDRIASYVENEDFRAAAVKTLLKVPSAARSPETSAKLVAALVAHAENTPPEDRTSNNFVDAMQLADQLMAKIPSPLARSYRDRLSEITVRVVRIRTVEEEMRYDVAYFAVEAGTSVQIVLENHDLMPHNLVITVPGALKEVAMLGLQVGPNNGWQGLQYVPESEKVLHATQMVPADKTTRLTFDAQTEPGEYPYVCTFPQHWYRMYGVMVVVEDLDAWLKNPVEPANPIGSNRSFVQSWTVEELQEDLDSQLRGRSAEIGKRLFEEASCAGCHKMNGEGGVIGPELTDIMKRWKGDKVGILREVIDPSHKTVRERPRTAAPS